MTPDELAPILAVLVEACPGPPVTEGTAEVWYRLLRDLRAEDVMAAALRHAASGAIWRPTPGQLRASVVRDRLGIGDAEDTLAEVLDAVRSRGWIKPPAKGDLSPVALAVVEAIGWQTLCDSDNPEALRAHVLRIAGTYIDRAIAAGSLAALGLGTGRPRGPVDRALPDSIGDVVRGTLPPIERRRLDPGARGGPASSLGDVLRTPGEVP